MIELISGVPRGRSFAIAQNRIACRSLFPPDLIARAADLVARYRAAALMAATAESCTGGLIAGLLTEIPGLLGHA